MARGLALLVGLLVAAGIGYGLTHTGLSSDVTDLDRKAERYRTEGRYADGAAALEKALSLREAASPRNSAEVARVASNLGTFYRELGRLNDAERVYRRALDLVSKGRDAQTATCLHNLGELYLSQHQYADAELMLEAARTIREEFTPDSAELALTLSNLGRLHTSRGDLARAELFLERAMAIDARSFGPKDPRVAEDLSNWAMVRLRRGDYQQAEQMLQKVLEIQEGALGLSHPALIPTLNGLAALYRNTGRVSLATPLVDRARRIRPY